MKFRPIPMLILAGALVAGYMVWRKSQPATTEGSAAVGDGFGSWFEGLFGNVAAGSTTPPAPAPAPAVAADNGT